MATPFQPSPAERGPPARVRIDQQRDHHRRIVRRTAVPIAAIAAIELVEIHCLDGGDHEPSEVVGRQPLVQARRQQKWLRPITPQEILCHPEIVPPRPDDTTALRNSHHAKQKREFRAR
jgi:hypothetical protein